MASILIRTILIYLLLSISLRLMGKRQLGELDVGELVSTLLVSEIASIPIADPDIPLFNAIIPVLFILSLEIILSTIKNKSEKMKSVIEGKPSYIIYKGRILQKALRDNRISVNELLAELRTQGVGDVNNVYYAAVEQNGSLSIIKKGLSDMAHTIIIDGEIMANVLQAQGFDEKWLKNKLRERKIQLDDIFLMTLTDDGKINIVKRDNEL